MIKEIVYIDLFSGTGGFPYGFTKAGLEFTYHYFSEIDKYAIANYKYNFKNAIYAGDIRFISGSELRKRHPNAKFIITFGFPCQDLSIAGKGAGFDGKRSVLFFEAIRLIQEIKPYIFIFENVKGLLSHNEGQTFEIVLRTIANIGLYDCEWQLLNTSWILPQNRERIYFVGHLTGSCTRKVFPFKETDFVYSGQNGGIESGIVNCIDSNYHKGWLDHRQRTHIIQKGRGFNDGGKHEVCPTISCNSFEQNNFVCIDPAHAERETNNCITLKGRMGTGGNNVPLVKRHPLKFLERNQKNIEGDYAYTIDSVNTGGLNINGRIRRLTENECELLQGFPLNWTKYGDFDGKIKEISATQRYKMLGNAVSTVWPEQIGKRLFKAIEETELKLSK